jgi:hypothetical protein
MTILIYFSVVSDKVLKEKNVIFLSIIRNITVFHKTVFVAVFRKVSTLFLVDHIHCSIA